MRNSFIPTMSSLHKFCLFYKLLFEQNFTHLCKCFEGSSSSFFYYSSIIFSDAAIRYTKICNLVSYMWRVIMSSWHNVSWCVFFGTLLYQHDWLLRNSPNICSSYVGRIIFEYNKIVRIKLINVFNPWNQSSL